MSIDDKFLRDPRVTMLGQRIGWSKWEVRGRLLAVFAVCYDLEAEVLAPEQIDVAGEHVGLADALFEARLADTARGGLRIHGARKRIKYLLDKSDAGRAGGLKSGESRRNQAKQNRSAAQAAANPPDPVPDDLPDPVPVPDQREKRHARGRRGADSTPAELAVAERVLARLGEHAGHAYSGAAEHVRLITGRLRDGLDEAELRAVVAFAADQWKGDPKMHTYLRPETLFGPTAIARYLDAARGKYAGDIAAWRRANASQPALELAPGATP